MRVVQQTLPAMRKLMRRPKHNFFLRHRPWQIQPFAIAPVLPGESLVKAQLQCRSVTDPLDNRVIGWWDEYYLFYVKLTDLDGYEAIQQALMDPTSGSFPTGDNDRVATYFQEDTAGANVDWVSRCLDVIVRCYFRDEGEDTTDFLIPASGGLPSAQINQNNWIESAMDLAEVQDPSFDPDLTDAGSAFGAEVRPSEIQAAMQQYEWARQMVATDMTFEDFCETYGVVLPRAKVKQPELLRYVRSWQYPSNTIDPANGAARSAVSWSHQVPIDAKKLFKEPGFIVGLTITRPKTYLGKLNTAAAALLNDSFSWLSPLLMKDPSASFKKILSGEPPFDSTTVDGIADMKDLFLHGDQFVNFDPIAVTNANVVALPSNDLTNVKYPAATDADNLFATKTAGLGKVEKDGVLSLHISGRQAETSPVLRGSGIQVTP